MERATDCVGPPSRLLLALEVRGILELQAFFAAYPLLRRAPRGDGHPVLVLPGLAASDVSTRPLRTYLRAQGYAAHGWKQGPNHGPRPGVETGMDARLAELAGRYQRKVSLIGWSLGGVFARELARRTPALVRQVITLGSPFAGSPGVISILSSKARTLKRSRSFVEGASVHACEGGKCCNRSATTNA